MQLSLAEHHRQLRRAERLATVRLAVARAAGLLRRQERTPLRAALATAGCTLVLIVVLYVLVRTLASFS